jgi:hypothetical protein
MSSDEDEALTWVKAYVREAGARQGRELNLSEVLLCAQARRAALIENRIAAGGSLCLPDPVGTGKTAMALVAAALLLDAGKVRRVVIVAPNEGVRALWEKRARWLISPKTGKPIAGQPFQAITRKQLADRNRPVKPEGVLVVIDEAHRGLQAEGEFQQDIEAWAKGCQVLLVTATPFQLSSQGLSTMLRIGSLAGDDEKVPVARYGAAVRALADEYRKAIKRSAPAPERDPPVLAALEGAVKLHADAVKVLSRRILPPDKILLDLQGKPPPLRRDSVTVSADWQEAYHVARVVPELLRGGKGDMFNRRLLSCSEAFWGGKAGQALQNAAKESKRITTLKGELVRQLGTGSGHPKVEATANWVAQSLSEGRHVLVFCVFVETQQALAAAIAARLESGSSATVECPKGASLGKDVVQRFRTPNGAPMALVLQDRFSESIDLDGGSPRLVHHDLPWTPARVTQRWGRVVRAESNFTHVSKNDIYVPVLNLDADVRLFDTVKTRAAIGDLLLPREILKDVEDADEDALPDELLDRLR